MIRGMVSFHPEDMKQMEAPAQVLFTGMTVYDKKQNVSLPIEILQPSPPIRLKSYQSTIFVDFSTLSYLAPEATNYTYCMEGLNNNWIDLNNTHSVHFTELSPGVYTLKVKAASLSGIWNDVPAELSILVLPPWWLSGWAKIIYLILSGCLAFYMVSLFITGNELNWHRLFRFLKIKKRRNYIRLKLSFSFILPMK